MLVSTENLVELAVMIVVEHGRLEPLDLQAQTPLLVDDGARRVANLQWQDDETVSYTLERKPANMLSNGRTKALCILLHMTILFCGISS